MKDIVLLRNHWIRKRRCSQVDEARIGIRVIEKKNNKHWMKDWREYLTALSQPLTVAWVTSFAERQEAISVCYLPLLSYKLIPWAGSWLPCSSSEVRWQATLPTLLVKRISCSPTCTVTTSRAITASQRFPSKLGTSADNLRTFRLQVSTE